MSGSHFVGAQLVVQFKGTVISGDQTEFKSSEEMKMVENSAGSDAAEKFLNTLLSGKADMTAYFQAGATAATAPYNLCAPGAEGTLIISPEGTASGKRKKTITSAAVKTRDEDTPYAGNDEMKISWVYNVAPSDSTW